MIESVIRVVNFFSIQINSGYENDMLCSLVPCLERADKISMSRFIDISFDFLNFNVTLFLRYM
jgi:hypothetical protein